MVSRERGVESGRYASVVGATFGSAIPQFLNQSRWRPEALLEGISEEAQRLAPGSRAFVIDDTGFAKQGRHSAGVARLYSGTLGKAGNCQVAVSHRPTAPPMPDVRASSEKTNPANGVYLTK